MSKSNSFIGRSVEDSETFRRLQRTGRLLRIVPTRRRARVIFGGVTTAYLAVFLLAVGDVQVAPGGSVSVFVVEDPIRQALHPAPGSFLFQPVALIELWTLRWELAPLNVLLGVGIAALVGYNLAFSYLAITNPTSCGIRPGVAAAASIPGLLAGSACCAPVVVLVLGIQASGLLLSMFAWLLPVSVVLLLGTLVYVAGSIDPVTV